MIMRATSCNAVCSSIPIEAKLLRRSASLKSPCNPECNSTMPIFIYQPQLLLVQQLHFKHDVIKCSEIEEKCNGTSVHSMSASARRVSSKEDRRRLWQCGGNPK